MKMNQIHRTFIMKGVFSIQFKWIMALGLLFSNHLCSQQYWPGERFAMPHSAYQASKISHQFLVFSAESPDTNRILLFIKLSNTSLQFVKTDSLFKGRYELTVTVQKEKNKILFSQIRRGELVSNSFHETRSRSKTKYEFFEFFLPPGEYELSMELYDLEIKKPFRKIEKMIISNFRKQPIASTDIIFLRKINLNDLESLKPLIPPIRFAEDTSFFARIDLFPAKPQNVTIYESIQNAQGKTVYRDTVHIQMKFKRYPIFFHLSHDLPFGQYTLNLHLVSGEHEKTLQSNYYIQWRGHPTSLPDMEMAIASMFYIMDKDLWQELQSAPMFKQKQILEEFWDQRDPVPETSLNELEEEYYQRVSFANKNFSIFQDGQQGWKTDRGRIYILYGPPSDVDIPPTRSDIDSRYEIWIYQQLQHRFIFFDKYNNGDYRLISQE